MTVFVTGGSGFIGSRVVRQLVARGEHVRALVRAPGEPANLAGLDVELVRGDLLEPASYRDALRGCEHVYHLAADYRLWSPRPAEMYRANVDGTRDLLRAAAEAGASRIVYTSSVGALGIPTGGVGDEATPVTLGDMVGHYKRSKFLAERAALAEFAGGAPVVIVNPSTPVGPGDIKPTPTGQMVVDFLNGRIAGFVDTGLNVIDVDDVATGHLLAAEKGRLGEKYILGHENLHLCDLLAILARLARQPAPRVRIPWSLAYCVGAVNTAFVGGLLRRSPRVPIEGVRMARKHMFFEAAKAVAELGLPQRPVEEALSRAIEWFSEHGYVRGKRAHRPGARGVWLP